MPGRQHHRRWIIMFIINSISRIIRYSNNSNKKCNKLRRLKVKRRKLMSHNNKLHNNKKKHKLRIIFKIPFPHIMMSLNHQQNIILKTHHHLHTWKKLYHHQLITNKLCSKGNKFISNPKVLISILPKRLHKSRLQRLSLHHHLLLQFYHQNHKF